MQSGGIDPYQSIYITVGGLLKNKVASESTDFIPDGQPGIESHMSYE